MKKMTLTILLLALGTIAFAGGVTGWAVPYNCEVIRGDGLLVWAAFPANPCNAEIPGCIFIPKDHPQYKEIYAAVLTAIAVGLEIYAYCHEAGIIPWKSLSTINYVEPYSALSLRRN
jgi:hypothetical protein